MFLRRISKRVCGVSYSYWHLCLTMRTERGPRQQVVVSLGKLDERELSALRGGWDDLPGLLHGEAPKPRPHAPPLPGFDPACPDDSATLRWEHANLAGLRVERSRDFGESLPRPLPLASAGFGLDRLLAELLPEGRESMAWSHIAALLTTARFCAQPSERSVAEWWFDSTALDVW